MSLGEVIRKRRTDKGLTQDQVSARVGISKPYLSNIETDKVKNPPSDAVIRNLEMALDFKRDELRSMAHLFRTPSDVRDNQEKLAAEVERLRGILTRLAAGKKMPGAGAMTRKLKSKVMAISGVFSAGRAVPVINKVAAGYPHHFTDLDYPASVADEYVRCPDVHDRQAFAARVVGDSMEPKYVEGDLVIFAPNAEVRGGDDCFVRFARDNSTTFKRYFPGKGGKIRLQPLNRKYQAEEYEREDISGIWPAIMRIERIRPA